MKKSVEKVVMQIEKENHITPLFHIGTPHKKQNLFFNFRRKYRYI